MMNPTQTELTAAIDAVLAAGKEILEVYAREFSVEEKDDRSPLTEADTRGHHAIMRILSEATPDTPVLSEEGAAIAFDERHRWDRYWLVDPLDGTKEFIKKNGEFTVNVALMAATEDGEAIPIAGAVFVPAVGALYLGVNGEGAWRLDGASGGESTQVSPADVKEQGSRLPIARYTAGRPYTIVASRSHMSAETADFIEARRAVHPNLQLISAGSSIKICRVAEGSADEYPRFAPTMEWDTAAGDAVARAAGCDVLQWNAQRGGSGLPLAYNKPDLHNPWFLVRRACDEGARESE
jgi:3'(2'), 5'-bisphosphate nucleotidase